MFNFHRILHFKAVLLPVLAAVCISLLGMFGPSTVRACWTVYLQECFESDPNNWPWVRPIGSGRTWRISPNPPQNTWGIQYDYYSTLLCTDQQGLWCMGLPVSNDPEFDNYPPSLDTYTTYGAVNLTTAVAARASFAYYVNTIYPGDSLFWGAANSPTLSTANMNIGGHVGGIEMQNFQHYVMDLSNLRRFSNGDSVSMLGTATVYVFFRFRANSDGQVAKGGFIDDVVITADDGGRDVVDSYIELVKPDSTGVDHYPPLLGDTLRAMFIWHTCDGGLGDYPDFNITAQVNTTVIMDTLMTGIQPDHIDTFYTPPFILADPGDYVVRTTVDALNAITETNENNNIRQVSFNIPPPNPLPLFQWITPGDDTMFVDSLATFRWLCDDPDEVAQVTIFYDSDSSNCDGPPVPGGGPYDEHSGIDSTSWDIHIYPNGRTYWIFAMVTDVVNSNCYYASFPMRVDHTQGALEPGHGALPSAYYLNQNYPNPFNPSTDIQFGIAQGGPVRLEVFDLLGRTVAVLMDDRLAPGNYSARFDGHSFASGVYISRLIAPEGVLHHKMMLLK